MTDKITVNGIEYVPVKPNGNRAVCVIDRGWVFAGDVTEANGRVTLTRVVWLRNWLAIGFDGVISDPNSNKLVKRKMDHSVDFPADAEIFRVPVSDDWGL